MIIKSIYLQRSCNDNSHIIFLGKLPVAPGVYIVYMNKDYRDYPTTEDLR